MEHRYGRHGPRAWLRWRMRRYSRPASLPVPVEPQPTIVRVFVPISVERIIFIIMNQSSNDAQGTTEQKVEFDKGQLPASSVPALPQNTGETSKLLQGDEVLVQKAQWRAFKDAKEIKSLIKSEVLVRINRPKVEGKIEDLVDDYLSNGGPPPVGSEYRRLVSICNNGYWKYFEEQMAGDLGERIEYLSSPEEVRLRDAAIRDKKEDLARYESDSHPRDRAVIRVLQNLKILGTDITDRLPEISKQADKYEKYYSNSGEEVVWPDQEPFRRGE